jgi:CheY-like chemotaxis protein
MSPRIDILLVDDEPRNIDALEAILDDPSYRLLRAEDADKALKLLLENDVAAIVLDIKMPGVSGFELAKLIKGTKRFREIPIVFLTAYLVEEADIVTGYGTGAVDYLTKPVNPVILRHKVAVFADLFRKTRALAELNDKLEERVAERTTELANERVRLQKIFDEALAALAIIRGDDLRVEIANPRILEMWGTDESVIGKPLLEAVPDLAGQGFDDLLRGVRNTGIAHRGTEVLARHSRNGALVDTYVDFVYVPLPEHDGSIDAVYVHAYEVTDKVKTRRHLEAMREEAEAASRMKDEFLATVSHELRTPLNAILGWATLLQDGTRSAQEQKKALVTIERNAHAQARLIDDILDVSRIIGGRMRLEMRPVLLSALVEAAVDVVAPTAEAKGVRLDTGVSRDVGTILADAHRLQQVLWNLLINAIKFTPSGGTVSLEVDRHEGAVRVVVGDSGAGIAPEHLPYVFDRFRQVDSSTTRKHGGLGLGLAITRHIVELHGGAITVASDGAGRGTTFTAVLPARAVDGLDADAAASRASLSEHPRGKAVAMDALKGVEILVVEDDDDARMLLAEVLEHYGAVVRTADSARAAFAIVETQRVDVLVSDIGMPDEDGYSLMLRVRELPANRGGRVPAIALTAYARQEDAAHAIRVGFQRHLPKPVDPAALVASVVDLVPARARVARAAV